MLVKSFTNIQHDPDSVKSEAIACFSHCVMQSCWGEQRCWEAHFLRCVSWRQSVMDGSDGLNPAMIVASMPGVVSKIQTPTPESAPRMMWACRLPHDPVRPAHGRRTASWPFRAWRWTTAWPFALWRQCEGTRCFSWGTHSLLSVLGP
jgi:hypothetical protein